MPKDVGSLFLLIQADAASRRGLIQALGRMKTEAIKRYVIPIVLVLSTAIVLSLVWHVPYIFTVIGFAVWAFVGHLVTADEDVPGGWSNPDGSLPFPWAELAIKALVLAALCILAIQFPILCSFGGAS
jgi:hypothetical protein